MALVPQVWAAGVESPAPVPRQVLDARLLAMQQSATDPIAGIAVVALRQGKMVYQGQAGFRRLTAQGQALPVKPDTLFRVASLSKLVVAIGAMRLVESGKLELDRDIGDYLGFPVRHPAWPEIPVTTRMLLGHTSGLRDRAGISFPASFNLATLLQSPPAVGEPSPWATNDGTQPSRPGSYFRYTNLNFGVLATVIEAVSGERFDRYIRDSVLSPLSIQGGFNPSQFTDAELARIATLYEMPVDATGKPTGSWEAQADDYAGSRPPPPVGLGDYRLGRNGTVFGPQGRLRIDVAGIGKLLRLIAGRGEVDGVRLLQPQTVAQMLSPYWQRDANGSNGDDFGGLFNAWGLGVQRFTDRGEPGNGDRLIETGGWKPVGHLGNAYGLLSGMLIDPVSGDGIVYVLSGTRADATGRRASQSSFYTVEAQLIDLLYRCAIRPATRAACEPSQPVRQ
ncbi:serine hydrolase [Chitinimonas sp. BJYL2]|uniref:serine hydrolase domain-containing protein n=1 Tax=Chitinimonas sp. BJYL2 TaxID=2976696 RepID=UPI0022B36164|nr:serine hydrolase [Chitinimonas sp. BJYL2]